MSSPYDSYIDDMFLNFDDQQGQAPSGFQYDYGNVQQPEPIQPIQEEVDEQGIIADFIDKVQGGAWGAAADIITGTRGLLTDDRVWEMEQFLRDQVTAQEETLSPAQLEADKGGAFESPRGFMGAVASGIGSIAPSMIAGGVAGIGGRALAAKAAQMAGATDKVQNVAENVGQFAGAGTAGAPMIGGAAANQVSEELSVMPNVEFSQLPNFDQYYQTAMQQNPDDPNSAMQMARDAYTQDAEKTAVRYGAAVGGVSMGVAGPYLEKILKGGQGIVPGAWLGARTEAAQEGFESGAQQAIVNPLAGRDVGEGVVSAAVEGGVLGGIIGGGVGGTAGGFRGAPGEVEAPIEEQQQPYVQQGPEEFLQPGAGKQGERPFFEEYVPPTQAEINESDIATQMQRDLDTESAIARKMQDDLYNDPFIEEQPAEQAAQEEIEQPVQEVQYPKPEKAITKMNPEELQQYSAEINNYADKIAQEGDLNNEVQAVEEIQRRVGILQEKPTLDETAHEAATSPNNELPEPTQAQKEAGKFKMGHPTVQGMKISVENPKGSVREGEDKQGNPWSVKMNDHYGYFKGTEGFDKDHLDVFMGPTAEQAESVYVVDQVTPSTGKFDEHKVMMGYDNIKQAEDAYRSNYDKDWKGLSNITEMPLDEFKQWAYSNEPKKGALVKPSAEAPLIKAPVIDLKERRDRKKAKQSYADYRKGVQDAARQKESEAVAKRDRDQQLAKDKADQEAEKRKVAEEKAKPAVDEDGYHTKLVEQSYAHSSNSPGRAATIHKREYEQTVQEVTETGEKLAKTPEQKEALTQAVDKFKQDYLDHERSLMGVRAGVVSGHIAGRSKFNAKQAGKRSSALDRAQDNFNKWLNKAKNDVERIVQAARTPEAVETDRKEATAKREKSIHTRLMRDIASSLAAMNEPGMDAAAFRPKATKNLKQALEQNEAETLRLMEVINKALKDDGGIEKTVGSRSNFWKMYKAAKDKAEPVAKKKTLKEVFKKQPPVSETTPKPDIKKPVKSETKPTTTEEPDYTIEYHNKFLKKLNSGDMTLEEFQASVKNFRDNKDNILAMLNSRQYTIPQLRNMAGYMMRGDEKKAEIADNVFDRLETAYLLDNDRPNLTWVMGVDNMQKGVDEQKAKIAKLIDSVTQADLDAYAKNVAERKAKRKADEKAREEAVKEPKTLDDFREFVRVKGKDALSPDQLESYDRLITAEIVAKRKEVADREASRQAKNIGDVDVETAETKHTKTGEDLYVVKLADRIDRERFNDMRKVSKQYNGFYSRYSVGDAIPGFQFKSESDRDEFLAAVSTGEVETAAKPKTNQERIAEMGDRLITRGEESLAQDRKTHTSRMAGMAASAEAKAENDITNGKLLKAISEADTDYLQGITALTQLEELQKVLARAEYKAPDELKDKDSMSRKTLKNDVTLNDYIQYAEFPNPIVMSDGLQSLARDLEDKTGYKNLAKSINSVLKRNPDDKINLDNYPKIDQAKIKKYAKLPGVYGSSQWIADYIQSSERLEKIGITSLPHLRMALRELNAIQEKVAGVSPEQKKAKELKQMERELVGRKMPGFFPTPKPLVEDLIDDADIQKGDKVLEPSAGKGDIADVLKEQGIDVYAVEMQSGLREILESKGHNVVGNDFLEITDKYDKIIMNPPFEDFQDIDHVMKAYELLNPNGRVVAVMGAGVNNTRKKATEFRAWVEEKGGTIEELPEGSFKSAFRPTGVNTVKVILDKPAAEPVSKTGTDYSKPGKVKQPVTHPDFSFTGTSEPAGLSERQIFNIINDKYGRPMFGASKFKNVDIINDPAKKWRGKYQGGQITLNAYYMTKDDAVRILQHEKVHEYIKQDPEFRKIAKDIIRRAFKNPNSAAGNALKIAKDRVPKDSKDYNRKIFEETMAYLVQYYNKPEVQGIFKRLAAAVAKFFRGKLGIKMNEDDAVDYLKDMVKAEAVGTETEQKAYKQEMADIMAGADVEEIEYSALGDAAGNITDRMTSAFESDFMDTMKSKINSQKWGVLNVRQIADVLGKYAPEIKNNYIDRFKRFEADMNKMKQDAGDIAMERQDLSKRENEKLAQVQHEATIEGYDPSMGEPDPNDKKGDFALREGIKTDYEQLIPEAKTIYTQERDYHKNMHDARLKALTERINAIEADEGFKESMVEKLHKEFDKAAKDGPYFPLARFGQYWVSSENAQGVKSFDMFENEYSQKRFVEEMRSDPNEEVIGSGMKLDNLKSVDGVSGQFIADVDKLIRKGGDSPVTQQIRDDVFQLYLETLPELSARKKYLHRGKVKGFAKDQARAFAQKARADANDVARLRHIHVLQNMIDDTETSLNIASSTKLKRQFSNHVEALQNALDDVPFGLADDDIQALNAGAPFKVFTLNETADPEAEIKRLLKKEKMLLENAEKITEDKIIFVANGLNELKKSHEAMVNNEVHPIASNLNSLGFLWYLGASPAAALVNLTQTPTVALPMMLADKSLKNSARYLAGAVKDFIAGKGTIEPTLNEQEKKAFNEWHDSGLLENTMAHDLSGVADSGIDTGTFKNKAMRMISFLFHRAEVLNREVTALATYRAAMAGGATHEQAVKKGADLTWNSHLDYGSSNRARFMRGNTMRVITQFKQYSQGITYIYGKTLLDTFKGETKQDRQQAMKLLGMLVSSQIAVAGTLGLPMAGVVMGITQGLKDAFDDDDDPVSVKAEFRQAMSDFAGQTGGQAISHGLIDAFTPLSMSGRLSMADLWVRTPDFDQEGKAEALSYIEALAGPMASIFTNMFMAKDSFKDGNYIRAAEQSMPKVIKDMFRTARYMTEGNLTKAGLKIKDMTIPEMIAQALGFSSSEVSDIRERATAIKNIEKKRGTRRKEIIDNWMDSEDRDMTEIIAWNSTHSRDRITSRTLRAARKSKMRYSKQYVKGVRLTKRNKDLIEEYDY